MKEFRLRDKTGNWIPIASKSDLPTAGNGININESNQIEAKIDNDTIVLNGSGNLSATNTTYTAGTGLSLSGTQFNHSNSVTAKTTQAIYPVTFDAQGHITGSGTAFNPATKQDVLTAGNGITISGNQIASKVTFTLNGTELTITSI